jgi:hypothetical protein
MLNRKDFIKSLAALLVAPKLLEGKEVVEDKPFTSLYQFEPLLEIYPSSRYILIDAGEDLQVGDVVQFSGKDGKVYKVKDKAINKRLGCYGQVVSMAIENQVILRLEYF